MHDFEAPFRIKLLSPILDDSDNMLCIDFKICTIYNFTLVVLHMPQLAQ